MKKNKMGDDFLKEKQNKEPKHKSIEEEEIFPIEYFALETKIRQLIQEFLNI